MEIRKVIEDLVEVSPAPRILPKLQRLLANPHTDIEDIVKLLKADVSITAQILKYANSGYYGFSQRVQSLDEAIGRLGFREVSRLVSVAVTKTAMRQALEFYNEEEGTLLTRSLACAHLMVHLSRYHRDGADVYYTTGLLHGIGKIVINQYFKKRGLSLYGGDSYLLEPLPEISLADERRILEFDHAEAGAELLSLWNFPSEMITAIRWQYEPDQAIGVETMTHALAFSRDMSIQVIDHAERLDHKWDLSAYPDGIAGLTNGKLLEQLEAAAEEYRDFNNVL